MSTPTTTTIRIAGFLKTEQTYPQGISFIPHEQSSVKMRPLTEPNNDSRQITWNLNTNTLVIPVQPFSGYKAAGQNLSNPKVLEKFINPDDTADTLCKQIGGRFFGGDEADEAFAGTFNVSLGNLAFIWESKATLPYFTALEEALECATAKLAITRKNKNRVEEEKIDVVLVRPDTHMAEIQRLEFEQKPGVDIINSLVSLRRLDAWGHGLNVVEIVHPDKLRDKYNLPEANDGQHQTQLALEIALPNDLSDQDKLNLLNFIQEQGVTTDVPAKQILVNLKRPRVVS